MARNEDGTYSQVGFIKDKYGNDITEYIYDKDGNIAFERGFTREVEGSLPLQINGIGKDLKDWSITGNTVQDGTPTPENPVEVLGCGERTANLVDFDSATFEMIGYSGVISKSENSVIYTLNEGGYNYGFYIFKGELDKGTYHVSCTVDDQRTDKSTVAGYGYGLRIKIGSKDWLWSKAGNKVSITVSEDVTFVHIAFYAGSPNTGGGYVEVSDIMINGGSEPLPYEPYGYKIPVVTRGKNLLKLKDVDMVIRGVTVSVKNNSITVKGTATSSGGRTDYLSETFILQPGTYFISGDIVNSMVYCLTDRSNGTAVIASSTSKFTLTEKTKVAFGLNFISGASYDATVNAMLNEGDKKFPYESYHEPITTPIYLPTPLYSGEVLRSDGSREVKWGVVDLGSMSYGYYNGLFYFTIPDKKESKTNDIISLLICEKYIVTTTHSSMSCNNYEIYEYTGSDKKRVVIRNDDYNNTKTFKEAMKGVMLYYELEDLKTETFTAPQIPTLNGTTIIDVDTVVKPTEMHVKCKSSK